MGLTENYQDIKSKIPANVALVAVSKTHSVEKVQQVYQLGQRAFGENKVQELVAKYPLLPADIEWHMIGHLQTNKVKYIAPFIGMIQSVDSKKLLKEINKQAQKHNRVIKVLLQIKIAQETNKTGMSPIEAQELLKEILEGKYPAVALEGLMGLASFTEDTGQLREEFMSLKILYDKFNQHYPLKTLSMGMSQDFPLAIECGANSVRVGSAIFGDRTYH